jgi:xanthine dehydrogenase accessory factor
VTTERILARATELRSAGVPFVLATVVWRLGPSSGKAGGRAIIHTDGSVEGWIGGACAQPTLVREALAAFEDGQSRLLSMGIADGARSRPGVVSVAMACESDGAMEVFVEPQFPSPQVVAIGRSPAVRALIDMAKVLGWRTALVDDGGATDGQEADVVLTSLDFSNLTVDSQTFVVVATQGHYDEVALESVLATGAGYIGLVASAKRAESVIEWLRQRGLPADAIERIHAPAGLDLGPVAHEEIAVSVLGELVRRKAEGLVDQTVEVDRPAEVLDLVCGMTVDPAGAKFTLQHNGEMYYFCGPGCQVAFEADPESFIQPARAES